MVVKFELVYIKCPYLSQSLGLVKACHTKIYTATEERPPLHPPSSPLLSLSRPPLQSLWPSHVHLPWRSLDWNPDLVEVGFWGVIDHRFLLLAFNDKGMVQH